MPANRFKTKREPHQVSLLDRLTCAQALEHNKTILVVDGDCALCSCTARLIARYDLDDHFRIAIVQSEIGRALFAEHGLNINDPESWLYVSPEGALTGAKAMIGTGRRLRGPLRLLAQIGRFVPGFIREPLYRFIARNRITWFGQDDLCSIPDPDFKARILVDGDGSG
jgi:predicted DCC family thiol-disulfide oxidoreductase YuxK